MAKSHWLINPERTEVKRLIKNDKSVEGVFEYMFVDTGKIVGVWRAKFGLDWNITAVLNDDEVIQRNKQVADAVVAMG